MRPITWRHQIQAAWRRRKALWPVAPWYMLLVTVVGGLGALSVLGPVPLAGTAGLACAEERSPAQYMAEGLEAFQRGDIERAAARWQEAAHLYARTQQPQAHRIALTHLAHAYEALGHYSQAVDSLYTALRLAEDAGDRTQVALILGQLGQVMVATGELADAERLVRDALAVARALGNAGPTAPLLHTHGNLFMAQQKPHEALEVYRDSAALAQQAQQFGMAARALAHAARAAEYDQQPQLAKSLLGEALAHLRHAESSHDTAFELLFIGRSYHRLVPVDPTLVLRAAEVLHETAALAQTLKDPRVLSYAWGYLGRLY
ncbi:MAG TPA: tetratricopeptide repeat protein, partial [Candidatus Tectomicrobia bacterium]